MTMTNEELKEKLDAHKRWLETRCTDNPEGEPLDLTNADLTRADLTRANLTGANLTRADLTDADLTRADLTDADLTCADLTRADLTDANLTGANLTRANLTDADLTDADLTDADLTDANLDYSAWPLKCSSLSVIIDKRLAAQLMYHAMRAMWSCKGDTSIAAVLSSPECVALANQFHRVNECGLLKVLAND